MGEAEFECLEGYALSHGDTPICSVNGTWVNLPICQAQNCPSVTPPVNGDVNYLTDECTRQGTVIEFMCDEGYMLEGVPVIYCTVHGNWSASPNPMCRVTECLVLPIANGYHNATNTVPYGDLLVYSCDAGYTLEGESHLMCNHSNVWSAEPPNCQDIDECSQSVCAQHCVNTLGSYHCSCGEGYELDGDGTSCNSVMECGSPTLHGCMDGCIDTNTSYTCTCDWPGVTLLVEDEIIGVGPARQESGLDDWNVLRYNESCVYVPLCPALTEPVEHGTVLSSRPSYYLNESLTILCDLGYVINGTRLSQLTLTCVDNSTWSSMVPTCSPVVCPSSDLDLSGLVNPVVPAVAETGFMEVLNLTCNINGIPHPVLRQRHCMYNTITKEYELIGDSLECGVIDCGCLDPSMISGLNITMTAANDTDYGSSFVFVCSDGVSPAGNSSQGNNIVTCQANGQWDLGSLHCPGPVCEDPGTPAGAVQIVSASAYHVDAEVHIQCLREGYEPAGATTLLCQSVDNATAMWNEPISECVDVTPPQFECDQDPVYVELYDLLMLSPPNVTDNSGRVVNISLTNDSMPLGAVVSTDGVVEWVAVDDSGNEATTCSIPVTVIDHQPVPWEYPCSPQNGILFLDDINIVATIDVAAAANYSIASPSDYSVTFDPPYIEVSAAMLDKITIVQMHVESTSPDTISSDVCMLSFTVKAPPCREYTLHTPSNGHKNCSTEGENRTCVMTCEDGHVFHAMSTDTLVYTCMEDSDWHLNGTETDYVPDCVAALSATFIETVVLAYVENDPSCASALDDAISDELEALNLLPYCASIPGDWPNLTIDIIDWNHTYLGHELDLTFVIAYENAPLSVLETCSLIIQSTFQIGTLAITWPGLNVINLDGCAKSPSYSSTTSITFSFLCEDGYLLQDTGEDKICVPCSSGTYKTNSTCELCPVGTYQNQTGQSECVPCPEGTNTDIEGALLVDMCVEQCPSGWVSDTSLPPCSPCEADTYWVNATMCETCPNGTSTAGVMAASNNESCLAKCALGHYSVSGFEPCHPCPVGFYQNQQGQTTCSPCVDGSSTVANGSTTDSQCSTNVTLLCDDDEYCNGNGVCAIRENYFVCECSEGFVGVFCENPVPDPCLSSPCYNNGTCVPDGLNYTCQCAREFQYWYTPTEDTAITGPAIDSLTRVNLTDCQDLCSDTANCLAFIVTANLQDPTAADCFLYQTLTTTAQVGTTLYTRQQGMVPVFNGSRCETDRVDACETSPCQNNGMCRDDVDGYTCFCSSYGGVFYAGDQCQLSTEICSAVGQECYNGATCVLMGTFRRYCECADGYTASQCEVEIDECLELEYPCLHGGNCTDAVNGYTCSCPQGYSGGQCENRPADLCDPDPCGAHGHCFEDYESGGPACVCEDGYGETSWTPWFNHGHATPDDREMRYLNHLSHPYYDHGLPLGIECRVAVTNTSWHEAGEVLRIPCLPELGLLCLGAEQLDDGLCEDYEVRYMLLAEYSQQCDQIDSCEGSVCLNGGICMDHVGYHTCKCAEGYEGSQCQHDVDDCLSEPCMNGGKCLDQLMNFMCECTPGYTSSLCETDIDECYDVPCDVLGSHNCSDLINDYHCECHHGFIGKNCSENINECASNPCLNGGQCVDQSDMYVCHCQPGWIGTYCQHVNETCQNDTCSNEQVCVNLLGDHHCSCLIGELEGQCGFTGSLCDIANPCVHNGQCVDTAGNVSCICPPGFTGSGCQYKIDFCGEHHVCRNGGECELNSNNTSYYCICPPGFSGDDCEVNIDDCPAAGCSIRSRCVDRVGEAFCRCPLGYSGPTCEKALDRDYDLEFCGSETTRLQFPFLSDTASLSMLAWVRFRDADTEGQFFCLESAEAPDLGDPHPRDAFCMHDTGMTFYVDGQVALHVNSTIPFGFINDGSWHYIAASWHNDTAVLVAYLDNLREEISLRDIIGMGVQLPRLGQLILGQGFRGWLSQVMVVGRALSTEELFQFNEGQYELYEADILQDWHGYHLGGCVQRVLDSTASYETQTQVRTSPQVVSCPSHASIYSLVRITTLNWPTPSFTGTTTVDQNYLSGSQGGTFKKGVYDIVYVGRDDEDGAAICAFPGYVRLNNCPDPVLPEGVELNCSDIDTLYRQCEVRCPAGHAFLHPMPQLLSCGPDGIWDPENPHNTFNIPHCGVLRDSKERLEFGWELYLQTTIITTLQSLESLLHDAFETWAAGDLARGICVDAECSNLDIDIHVLDEENNIVTVDFVLDHVNSTVGAYGAQASDVVYQAVMLDDVLLVPTVSYADEILQDSFYFKQLLVCPPGAQPVTGICVECPSGTFFNSSAGLCQDCSRGQYQPTAGQLSCLSCPPGETTEMGRSTTVDNCYTMCDPGHSYSNSSCEPCGRGYYQSLPGQTYCNPCDLGRVTRLENSTSCYDCIDDCPDGTQLSDGEEVICVNCSVGTYRTQGHHAICMSCPMGFTTPTPGAESINNCSLG